MEAPKRNLRARKPLSDCTNIVASSQPPASKFSSVIKPRKQIVKPAVKDVVNKDKKGDSNSTSASKSYNLQTSSPSPDCLPTEASTPPRRADLLSSSGTDCELPPEPQSFYSRKNPTNKRKSIEIAAAPLSCSASASTSYNLQASNPSSDFLPTEASTPPRGADLPSNSGTDFEFPPDPQSFYSRRHPTNKRKSTEIAFAPIRYSTASKILTVGEKRDGYSSPAKARTVPCKKRQRATTSRKEESKIEFPREFVEQQRAYFSEVDAFELPVEEVKTSDSE